MKAAHFNRVDRQKDPVVKQGQQRFVSKVIGCASSTWRKTTTRRRGFMKQNAIKAKKSIAKD
jgi:hypothetical protein